jgi:hypothetical protein
MLRLQPSGQLHAYGQDRALRRPDAREPVLGPRVPAVLVSPYIEPQTVFRAPAENWLQNDDNNSNYFRIPREFYADTRALVCPDNRIVTGIALRQMSTPDNRLTLQLLVENHDGSNQQWLQQEGNTPDYFGKLSQFYADTKELICPPDSIVRGVGLRQMRTPANRLTLQILVARPNGNQQWITTDGNDSNYIDKQLAWGDFYVDTSPLRGPVRAQLRGVAFYKKGNRLALKALLQGAEYDHTSILASLRDWVGASSVMLGANERIRRAPTVWPVLTRMSPRTDNIQPVPLPPSHPSQAAATATAPTLTHSQINILAAAEAQRTVFAEAGDDINNEARRSYWEERLRTETGTRRDQLSAAVSSGNLPSELVEMGRESPNLSTPK